MNSFYHIAQMQLAALVSCGKVTPEQVFEIAINTFTYAREAAIADDSPIEKKLETVDFLHDFYLEREDYTRCAFLRDFKRDLLDAEGI